MNATGATVLILGAKGRLGRPLVDAFSRAGWQVRAQLRAPHKVHQERWPHGVEPCYCDAYDREELTHCAVGADVVINGLNPPYTDWEHNAMVLAHNAIAAARTSGALLLFPGNIYNFGNNLPTRLEEDTPQYGNTTKGQIRIGMELALRSAASDGLDCAVLRCGDYFGATARDSWFDLMIGKQLHQGKMLYPGPFDREHAWSYLDDFTEVFVRIATQRGELNGYHQFHFPGYTLTGAQLHQALQSVINRPLTLRRMAWWPLQLAKPFYPMARALTEMRYLWERPHRLEDGALEQLIGPLPATPLHEALQTTLTGLELLLGSLKSSHA